MGDSSRTGSVGFPGLPNGWRGDSEGESWAGRSGLTVVEDITSGRKRDGKQKTARLPAKQSLESKETPDLKSLRRERREQGPGELKY